MRQKFRTPDVDAQHIGALLIAAHRVEAAAQLRPAQQAEQDDDHHKGHHHADLHIGRHIDAQLIDRAHARDIQPRLLQRLEALVLHVELGGVDDGRHALGEEHARQRNDKGLDLQIGHQKSLYHAEQQADQQRQQQCGQNAAAVIVQMDGADHAHQRRHGAHRDIDAAGDHDDAHAAGEDDQRGILVEDVKERLRLQKAGAEEYHRAQIHDGEHRDGDDQQEVRIRHGRPILPARQRQLHFLL